MLFKPNILLGQILRDQLWHSKRVTIDPLGFRTVTDIGNDSTSMTTLPDGTVLEPSQTPDPRWGMLAPLSNTKVSTPSGLVSTIISSSAVTLEDPDDPLSLLTKTDTISINGRVITNLFEKLDEKEFRITTTTPLNRVSTSFFDKNLKPIKSQVPNLADIEFAYDIRGRLVSSTQGTGAEKRNTTVTYIENVRPTKGLIASITDPLSRIISFEYDSAGRTTKEILPDLREIITTYDANGNVASIKPPGQPAHLFQYNAIDLETHYTPPDIELTEHATLFTYNLDQDLTLITRPDGQSIQMTYDAGG